MKYSTKARFDYLEQLVSSINDQKTKNNLFYIIESLKSDLEENYAEIVRPDLERFAK
jgi:hypothetical protein